MMKCTTSITLNHRRRLYSRVCRQINSEAKGMHQVACREYFSTTRFTSSAQLREGRPSRKAHLELLRRHGLLGLIRHLESTISDTHYSTKLHFELSHTQRAWKIIQYTTDRQDLKMDILDYYFAVVPRDPRFFQGSEVECKLWCMTFRTEEQVVAACAGKAYMGTMEEKILAVLRNFELV